MPLPQIPTTSTDPNPIEALPAPSGEGFVSGMYSSLEHSLGISLETQAIGKMAGGSFVPYADAKAQMEAQGYDASVLPAKGLNSGELNAIMNQQSAIKRNEAITQQSDLGTFGKVTSHLIGGAGDPLFLAAGPILGRLGLTVKGMGLGGRVLAGGVEGSATMAGYDIATRQFGTAPGDHDLSTQQIVRDSLLGGLVGGVLHGAFGQRAAPKAGIDSYLNMIQVGENSAGAAKSMGISEDAVVSKADAVGRYQVTPGTAKQYGFNPDMLKDPAYNKQAATAILTDLQKRFGDDPDAIAIGYNAGPGVAKKFLKAGRDRSVLPKETRDYLNRIAAKGGRPEFGQRVEAPVVGPDTGVQDAQDAASTALQAAETDSGFRTNPFRLADEHADHVTSLESEAMQIASQRRETDTRGGETYFHGTSRPIEKLSDYPGNSEGNIFGHGLYTTDAADIARGYSKKGGGGERTVYQVSKTGTENLVDMEQPMPKDVADVIREQARHHDIVGMATDSKEEGGDGAATLREVYDSIRSNSSGEGLTKSDVQEIFDGISHELMKKGYTGLKHIGGKITGKSPHKVEIHWEPETRGISLSERPDLAAPAHEPIAPQRKVIPPRPSTQSIEPGSKFTTELAAKPIVDRIAAQTPKADDSADLKASTDAVVNEAQAHSPEGEEFAAHMEDVEDELHKQGYSDEMVKAVHAAVRCGLSRGFD